MIGIYDWFKSDLRHLHMPILLLIFYLIAHKFLSIEKFKHLVGIEVEIQYVGRCVCVLA